MRERRNLQSNQDNNFKVFDTRKIEETLGCTPARGAARLNPIDALRHE